MALSFGLEIEAELAKARAGVLRNAGGRAAANNFAGWRFCFPSSRAGLRCLRYCLDFFADALIGGEHDQLGLV